MTTLNPANNKLCQLWVVSPMFSPDINLGLILYLRHKSDDRPVQLKTIVEKSPS